MSSILFFLFPFVIALGMGPLVIKLYTRNRWLDDPKKSNHPKITHTTSLPRGGGLIVGAAILTSMVLLIPLEQKIVGIILGALVLIVVGLWDDIKNPSPFIRLGLQAVAALIVIASGVGIAYITNPFGGVIQFDQPQLSFQFLGDISTIWIVADIVAFIWIMWCMNSINFATGLDGQMPGYVAIASLVIGLLSLRFLDDPSQSTVLKLALIVCGAYVGLLYWNMYPQRLIVGFGASTVAGFMLAVLAILSGAKLATAILVLAVPMADAFFVIVRRLKNKKSPFWGDRSHLHHALLDAGLSKPQVAGLYWISAAVLGLVALQLSSEQKAFTILLVGALLCMILVWLRFFTTQFGKSGRDSG